MSDTALMRSLFRTLLLLLVVGSTSAPLAACTVEDGLLDNKPCDPAAPKERQCIQGYVPTQKGGDAGCICEKITTTSAQLPHGLPTR